MEYIIAKGQHPLRHSAQWAMLCSIFWEIQIGHGVIKKSSFMKICAFWLKIWFCRIFISSNMADLYLDPLAKWRGQLSCRVLSLISWLQGRDLSNGKFHEYIWATTYESCSPATLSQTFIHSWWTQHRLCTNCFWRWLYKVWDRVAESRIICCSSIYSWNFPLDQISAPATMISKTALWMTLVLPTLQRGSRYKSPMFDDMKILQNHIFNQNAHIFIKLDFFMTPWTYLNLQNIEQQHGSCAEMPQRVLTLLQ